MNTGFTMSRAASYDPDRVYVLGYKEGEAGTRVFRWTGKWDNYYVPFVACGLAVHRSESPLILTVGVHGSVHGAGPAGFVQEAVDDSSESPRHRGALRDVRAIGDSVFCTGLGRQVYRRTAQRGWQRFDSGVVDALGSSDVGGFESIDGFAEDDIYAVGISGDMFQFADGVWSRLDSLTNGILSKVLCCPDGNVYVCGKDGFVAKGRGNNWAPIDHEGTDTFWDMAWYEDHLWLATSRGLFRLRGSELERIAGPWQTRPDTRYLCSTGKSLWSVGARRIDVLENHAWIALDLP